MTARGALRLILMVGLSFVSDAGDLSADAVYDCHANESRDQPTTIEIVLAPKWKSQADEIKRALASDSDGVKVRVKFYPFVDPPTNIGIGKCVPADIARRAMQAAMHYSGATDRLIRQDIMPHHWIKIGSTDTAELAWTSVRQDDMARLMDPNLSNEQFQDLYRSLAEPKERHLPFGMGTQPLQEAPR